MKRYEKLAISEIVKRTAKKPLLELDEQGIEKLKNFTDVVLGILIVGGILTMTVLAPNALRALKLFEKKKGRKRISTPKSQKKIARAFYYLRQSGQVQFIRKGNDYEVVLTDKGKKRIKRLSFDTMKIKKDGKWDGQFWQVAADIPTEYRLGADAFRDKLKSMDFYSLQRTLWFYPYDPKVEIEFIARTYGIDSFVTVMKIASLDPSDENVLRTHFKQLGII